MPRIGDTIRPELQRADTSGMLKGAAIGAEAMGQGLAALGAGVGKGLEKRKAIKDFTKEKEVQATALAKFLPDSPLKEMAQGAADFLNDPEARQSERFAFAKTLEPNFKLASDAITTGVAAKTMQLQASARKGHAMGLADFVHSQGDPEKLAEISIGSLRELGEDQEAVNAYKSSAMQAILAQQKGTRGSITKLEQPFVGPDGKKYTRSAFQQDGSQISEWEVVPDADVGPLGPDGQPLTEAEKVFNAEATKDLVPWASGGASLAQNEVDKLDGVLQGFDDGTIKTGPLQGTVIPDVIRANTVKQREKVHSIIAKSIKELFGGNPSLEEVKRLFQFAWNDQLPEAANRAKVVALQKDLNDRIRRRNEQLKELTDTGFVLPRGSQPPVSKEKEPAKTQRDLSQESQAKLRAIRDELQKKKLPSSPVAPGPDDKKVDLRVSQQVSPARPGNHARGIRGIPEWYANPESRAAFEQAQVAPGAPSTFEEYSNLSSAEKLSLRNEAIEGAPRAEIVPEAPAAGAFRVLSAHRGTSSTRAALKGVKHVVSTDFNAGEKGKRAPAPGIEAVVPENAPASAVAKVKQYLQETEDWFRSKGVKTSVRSTGKNKDGILYQGKSSRFYYTEPFFKTDAASREAIEKDPRGYARILARTLGSLPGVTFIPPHTARDKGAELPGSEISEQAWSLQHVIPYLQELSSQ